MTKSTVTIKTEESYSLTGFLYESTAHNKDEILGTLIYLHGGGLVFGEKTDLPLEYLDILRSRFDVLLADYRLAPESNIDDIFSDLQDLYHFAASLKHENIYVLGRSAGAYLSLMMARDFNIAGVIDFYGYFNFTHSDFDYLPHDQKHLSSLLIDDLEVTNTRDYVTVNEPVDPRYLLYLYYRHKGNWKDKLGIDVNADKYRLTQDDFSKLPPIFIVHAKGDPDVPVFFSRKLSKSVQNNEFLEIDTTVHNFDQEVTDENLKIYEAAVQFMADQR